MGQCKFFMACTHDGSSANVFQDCCAAVFVSIHLNIRPRLNRVALLVTGTNILGFDANEVTIAILNTLPDASTRMPDFASSNHPILSRTPQDHIAQPTAKIMTTVNEHIEIRKITV